MTHFLKDDELDESVADLKQIVALQKRHPKSRIELYRQKVHGTVPIYLVTHSYASKISKIETSKFFTDLTAYTKGQIELTKLLGHDYIYSAADIFDFEAEALGAKLAFPSTSSNPSLIDLPLAEKKDFSRLQIPDPCFDGRMPALLGMKDYLQKNLGCLFEFEATGSSPFSLACNIRGYQKFLMDMVMDQTYAYELLNFCIEVCKANLSAQLQLGLTGIHIADAWAAFPMVNESIYEKFIFPSIKKLFSTVNTYSRSWSGLYGLTKIQDWKAHLKRIVECGVTELCIYQEDLLRLNLGELADLTQELGVTTKFGLFGTNLTPYNSSVVMDILKKWTDNFRKRGGFAIHVSNVPWGANIEDIQNLVVQIRTLETQIN
jgi:uroporphyrinogen-III decarboxylase